MTLFVISLRRAGAQKPAFLRKYFVTARRFGKNPVSSIGVRNAC